MKILLHQKNVFNSHAKDWFETPTWPFDVMWKHCKQNFGILLIWFFSKRQLIHFTYKTFFDSVSIILLSRNWKMLKVLRVKLTQHESKYLDHKVWNICFSLLLLWLSSIVMLEITLLKGQLVKTGLILLRVEGDKHSCQTVLATWGFCWL